MIGPGTQRRAQSTVEFALVLPVLFILLVAVIDAGRFMLALTALSNAVREGARAAVTTYPSVDWETRVADRTRGSAPILDPADLFISVNPATDSSGTFVTVTGEYHLRPLAPFITMVFTQVPMRATSRMLVQSALPVIVSVEPLAQPDVEAPSGAGSDEEAGGESGEDTGGESDEASSTEE